MLFVVGGLKAQSVASEIRCSAGGTCRERLGAAAQAGGLVKSSLLAFKRLLSLQARSCIYCSTLTVCQSRQEVRRPLRRPSTGCSTACSASGQAPSAPLHCLLLLQSSMVRPRMPPQAQVRSAQRGHERGDSAQVHRQRLPAGEGREGGWGGGGGASAYMHRIFHRTRLLHFTASVTAQQNLHRGAAMVWHTGRSAQSCALSPRPAGLRLQLRGPHFGLQSRASQRLARPTPPLGCNCLRLLAEPRPCLPAGGSHLWVRHGGG